MKNYLKALILPVLILTIGISWSLMTYKKMKVEQLNHARNELDLRKEKILNNIKEKLKLYEYGLKGLKGAILSQNKFDKINFDNYSHSRNYHLEFPGALGIGFIEKISKNKIDQEIKNIQKEYQSKDYQYHELGEKYQDAFLIKYISPADINKKAIGLDIATEKNRREAAIEAAKTGEVVLTNQISLVQDQKKMPGFLIFLPIYTNEEKLKSKEERLSNLIGWTYAPIIINSVFDQIIKNYFDELELEIYCNEVMTEENLIYDADHSKNNLDLRETINGLNTEGQFIVGKKVWSYYLSTRTKFNQTYLNDTPKFYLGISIIITTLLSFIIFLLTTTLIRTEQIVEEKTASLIKSEQAAKNALKVKSEFLATMSHEIRTPLNGILGLIDVLKETKLDENQKYYLENISAAGKSLKTIIDDVLDFSKIEDKKFQIAIHDFDLKKLADEIYGLYLPMAKDKNIKLNYHFSEKIPHLYAGDEYRIKQIISNLLSNAIKFTEVGEVRIDILGKMQFPGQYEIMLKIKDTGIGIKPEALDKLFNKFTQADSSTTRRFGGTGLGLSISKMLIDKMHGKIEVDSQFGEGTTFTISLPLKVSTLVSIEQTTVEQEMTKRIKVLLVEDNEINALVVKKILNKLEVEIDHAVNGAEAVTKAIEKNYDIILMDCQMPVMDGFEATKEIRKTEIKKNFIVALTANAYEEDKEKCLQAGMDEFLAKPINKRELFSVLKRCS